MNLKMSAEFTCKRLLNCSIESMSIVLLFMNLLIVPNAKYRAAFIRRVGLTKYMAYKLVKYSIGMMLSMFLKLLKPLPELKSL